MLKNNKNNDTNMVEENKKNIVEEETEDINTDININCEDIIEDEIIISDDLDEDLFNDSDDDDKLEIDNFSISKHKIEGKHALKYDTIFKGKKEESDEESELTMMDPSYDSIELDVSSNYYVESNDSESYFRSKKLKEKIYEILEKHTDVDFTVNRRKPSKLDFNSYICILKKHLSEYNFTNVEIFNELAYYFSDNLFNMFKLLDSYWKQEIIKELQEHIGKSDRSKEIRNRNIYVGTEIEFEHIDLVGNRRLIQGIVRETDYPNSIFKVDSYENIYEIGIKNITKIINNTKFDYNLNKLNNIDFL